MKYTLTSQASFLISTEESFQKRLCFVFCKKSFLFLIVFSEKYMILCALSNDSTLIVSPDFVIRSLGKNKLLKVSFFLLSFLSFVHHDSFIGL